MTNKQAAHVHIKQLCDLRTNPSDVFTHFNHIGLTAITIIVT